MSRDFSKYRPQQTEKRRSLRAEWLAKNGPCKHCGSTEQLEVDHIDPSAKVGHKVWSWSPARREAELAKCQVLCRPCHQKKTNDQLYKPRSHGTSTMYRAGCRCDECKESARKRVNAWRWKTGVRVKKDSTRV